MRQAHQERLKAYAYLVAFIVLVLTYGYFSADTIREATTPLSAPIPLLAAALGISLATAAPMVMAFRPSNADKLVAAMRQKARRADKAVTFRSAARSVSFYIAALASTPVVYGLALLFLVGEFVLMLLLVPAAAVLAAVGWFVLERFFPALGRRFIL